VGASRFVGIGEASHGTHEYYRWRAELSRRLIEEHGFRWIGVEGDWPDCWRINRWVRGQEDQDLDAYGILAHFERWPTWMSANEEVAQFLGWLHQWNLARPEQARVGFYGLDVYSLWDSLRNHFVAGDQRSGRGADRVTRLVVFRAVPRGPAGIRLEHAPGPGNVRGRRRRSPGGGAPPDEPSRGRR
jgi:erythromycin esterase-like protein